MRSLELGILGGTGYSIDIRLFKTSASSDTHTTGRSSGAASFRGWGRENMSLKKGDDMASTDLWTRKSTRSDDRRMTSALSISEYFGREVASPVDMARPSASELVP